LFELGLIAIIDQTAWVKHHIRIDIKKWHNAKRCNKVYQVLKHGKRLPIHYNQYVALSSAREDGDLLERTAFDLDWEWEKTNPKIIQKALEERIKLDSELDASDYEYPDETEQAEEEHQISASAENAGMVPEDASL